MHPEELSKLHYGLRIEARAEQWYLARHPGARLLERNFRWRGGEIDLIFEQPCSQKPGDTELVFVEVRARQAGSWVSAVESVRGSKLARLQRGISLYLARYRGMAWGARLDLLGWDGKEWSHLPNAWGP